MNYDTLHTRYREAILTLAEKYKLENVRVFGSTVRGEAREDSDIDLLVHPKQGCSLFDLVGFELDVATLTGKKVDTVSDNAIKELLEPFILSEARPL